MYNGYTNDLRRRLWEHNTKKGGSYTSKNAPFELIHYEAFLTKKEAVKQEKFYKTGYGKEVLKNKIEDTLKNFINYAEE